MAERSGTIYQIPLLAHIKARIVRLEAETKGVVALQFAEHPHGLSMVVRIYLPATEKEYVYPDVIAPFELVNRENEQDRIDVLFDLIHKALESIQVVQDKSGGFIHH